MLDNKNCKYKQITITTFRRCLCRRSAENLTENNRLKSHYTVNDSTSFLLRNIDYPLRQKTLSDNCKIITQSVTDVCLRKEDWNVGERAVTKDKINIREHSVIRCTAVMIAVAAVISMSTVLGKPFAVLRHGLRRL